MFVGENYGDHDTEKLTFTDTAETSHMLEKDLELGRRTTSARNCIVSVRESCGMTRAQENGTRCVKLSNVSGKFLPIRLEVLVVR